MLNPRANARKSIRRGDGVQSFLKARAMLPGGDADGDLGSPVRPALLLRLLEMTLLNRFGLQSGVQENVMNQAAEPASRVCPLQGSIGPRIRGAAWPLITLWF